LQIAWGPEEEAFRAELLAFLDAHTPEEALTGYDFSGDAADDRELVPGWMREWQATLFDHGWMIPGYPPELGGRNCTPVQTLIYLETLAGRRIPRSGHFPGYAIVAPSLLEFGNDEQRAMAPSAIRGDTIWCIGMSEPNAGSDLAGLQTRADVYDDHFVVNGQKVWTSYGDKADWMFVLVRTDFEAKKQEGITFLLMDMTAPGVSVQPIRLISGSSPFTETFLSDVRVPVRNVVGKVNNGWAMAKALLGHERTMIADAFKERDEAKRMVGLARDHVGEENGRIADPMIRDAMTRVAMDQACLDLTLERSRDNMKAGHKPGPETSIFKYYGTELNMRRRELMVSILGPQGLGWEGPGYDENELKITRDWLRSRGNSIEGGTSEIQLNIIAKRVLGLPD